MVVSWKLISLPRLIESMEDCSSNRTLSVYRNPSVPASLPARQSCGNRHFFQSAEPLALLHLPQIPLTEKPNAGAARGAKKIRTFPASFRFGVTLP
jgi:hypothetical protein